MKEKENYESRLIIEQPENISAEQRFLDLWNGTTNVLDENSPQYIFLKKDGKTLFILDLKNGHLLCDFELVWLFFSKKYSMNYEQLIEFIKDVAERRLGVRELKPWIQPSVKE